jgi:hypothetical protein
MEKTLLENLASQLSSGTEEKIIDDKTLPDFEPQKAPKLAEEGGYQKRQAFLSPVQLGDLLGMEAALLRRAFKAKKLPHYKLGARYYGILDEILQAMAVGIKNSIKE